MAGVLNEAAQESDEDTELRAELCRTPVCRDVQKDGELTQSEQEGLGGRKEPGGSIMEANGWVSLV